MNTDQIRNRGWAVISIFVLITDIICIADGSKDALISAACLTAVVLFDLWVVYG